MVRGLSLQWLLLLWSTGSRCEDGLLKLWCKGLVALQHVKSSRPGIEPVSPALAGTLLYTGPLGKSLHELIS